MDLAEVAFTAWAEEMAAATNSIQQRLDDDFVPFDLVTWAELDDDESEPWIDVEQEFRRLRDAEPVEREPVEYELQVELPGLRKKTGAPLTGRVPKPPRKFKVRSAVAGDCLAAEEFDNSDRECRIIYACMQPVAGTGSLWDWRHFGDLDVDDLMELRRLVFTGPRLDGQLYEAWRRAALRQYALEAVKSLHPDDVPAFLELERNGDARQVVLAALDKQMSSPADNLARWTGPVEWPDVPSWETVYLTGSPNRYIWMKVAFALASAAESGERLLLFSTGLPREVVPVERMRAKDIIAMNAQGTAEAKMLALVASLSGTPMATLKDAAVDDYERLYLTGMAWLGNRQRERVTKRRGSPRGSESSETK